MLPAMVGLALIALWSLLVQAVGTKVFPTPGAVLAGFEELARSGRLAHYTRDSLWRVGVGYVVATVLGIPLGLLMGRYASVAASLDVLLQFMRPISPIAWIPVAIVLFGVGDHAAFFLVFLGCFFPIVLTTANAVRTITPIYTKVGRNFGMGGSRLFLRVILPGALPQIFTGLRVALGIGWLVVVAAEMVAVDSGLGYLVLDARNAGKRYDLVVAGILAIGAVGLALDVAFRRLEATRWMRWARRNQS